MILLGLWPAGAGARPLAAIKEPLFAVLFELVEGDSLGVWTGSQLQAMAARHPGTSRFPLELITGVRRRPAAAAEAEARREGRVHRIWDIELTGAWNRPLPYSILGYHPGSLRVAARLVLSEWRLGDLNLHCRGDPETPRQLVQEVRVLRLDAGHVVLDADALVDRLLGAALDDSWTLGFVMGRQQDQPLALAVSVGRQGQRLFGEMDLIRDEILAHGRPLAEALSRACRPYTDPAGGGPSRAWGAGE